jgi:hypothetical protein
VQDSSSRTFWAYSSFNICLCIVVLIWRQRNNWKRKLHPSCSSILYMSREGLFLIYMTLETLFGVRPFGRTRTRPHRPRLHPRCPLAPHTASQRARRSLACSRASVLSVCSKCFICSKRMLQLFCLDVVKVDLDVAYTYMLQAYVLSVYRCFIHMFASVSSGWCICLQWFSNVFRHFRKCFRRLFQVFYLSYFVRCNCCILMFQK